ncbi:MAG: hypothetical protein AB7R89_06130 [Dehalococcoidia bacterium]
MSDELTHGDISFARVMTVHGRALIASDDELLKLARKRALDDSTFDEFPPFFFGGEISNGRWDSYDTKMGVSTLRNYAKDASAGVAYLRAHNNREDATGASLKGLFLKADGDSEFDRVQADFYVPQTPGNVEHVTRIKTGVIRDLSVGFSGGEWICSICGRDMMDWFARDYCPHFLGFSYPIEGGEETQVARATIENARLIEVSGVYKGATPGAAIAKARALAGEGMLDELTRDLIQVRYRVSLPGPSRRFPGIDALPSEPGEESARGESQEVAMGTTSEERQTEPALTPTEEALVRLLAARSAVRDGETPIEALTRLLDEADRLRPLADDGRAYRADLISAALAEGVRAYGDGFAQETYRAVLESSTLDVIKRMRDDWQAVGDKQFPGGRQTVETEEQAAPAPAAPLVPDFAFRA